MHLKGISESQAVSYALPDGLLPSYLVQNKQVSIELLSGFENIALGKGNHWADRGYDWYVDT